MSLRTKFLISLVIASAAITMSSLWMVRRSVSNQLRPQLQESLRNSATAFRDTYAQREAYVQRTAELIADDARLKALLALGDARTAQEESGTFRDRAGTGIMVLAGPAGKILAVDNADAAISRAEIEKAFAHSFAASNVRDWWLLNGKLIEVVLQPISSGEGGDRIARGVLALGFEMDDALAREAARIVSGNVAFLYNQRVIASTLSAGQAAELEVRAKGWPGGDASDFVLNGETFIAHRVSLGNSNRNTVDVVMLRSYDLATNFLASLNRPMVAIALAAIFLGTIFVFLISHTFTRPIAELVSGVRALGKGDFSYPLHTEGKDEIAELTGAFDTMRKNLGESQSRLANAARMEGIGQLAGGVAHDFNNLITIIKGYTELLMLKLSPDDPAAGFAEQIRKAGDRAASVTRQLLAFSRKQVVQPDVIDLNAVALGMEKMLKVLIGEDIEFKITSEADLRKVFADPGQLEQVLLNLAVNARDAMPKGGKISIVTTNVDVNPEAVHASIGDPDKGLYVRLSFTDSGGGMSAETAAKVFQPFFTTKETGKGTGLGLAIISGIVKQAGGFIVLTSELGRGSTFDIYLPETERAASATSVARTTGATAFRGAGVVLLVEDEDALRALGREALRMRGFEVLEARNGREGIEVFQANTGRVDLVVTDVVMPQLSGVDLVERLRTLDPKLKVLFISGYTDRIDEIEKSGARLLQKPFTPDQLSRAVTEVIGGAQATAAAAPA
ncbi:MAG: response regulator [Terriglobales bacterium]